MTLRGVAVRSVRVAMVVAALLATGLLSGSAAGTSPGGPPPAAASEPAAVAAVAAATSAPAPTAPAAPVAPAAPPAPALAPGTPCLTAARACVDRANNLAWLIRDGRVEYGPVPITHGRKGWRTPPGVFHVTFKNRNHRSSIFNNAPMPYSVFFNGGIAFHQGSIRSQSHGCVRLTRESAKVFYRTLSRGDMVQVV